MKSGFEIVLVYIMGMKKPLYGTAVFYYTSKHPIFLEITIRCTSEVPSPMVSSL